RMILRHTTAAEETSLALVSRLRVDLHAENVRASLLFVMLRELKDITIIGAGPCGLFGLFYAGMRGVTAQIVDALPEPGGQLMALYPEKFIFDVAGFPKVFAKDLVK